MNIMANYRHRLIWVPSVVGIIVLAIIVGTSSELHATSGITEQFRILYPGNGTRFDFVLQYVSDFAFVLAEKLTLYNVILCGVLFLATYFIQRQLFTPYELVRNFGDVGYITDGRNKKEVANEIRKRRRAGDVPPVYPNGWFSVLRSWELKQGEVKYVSALGKELAVYRGENGQAYIVDAYCPHLGANLGVGGIVKGDCIECPFHGWIFRGSDGKCVDIPYTQKVPSFAKTKAWKCVEVNGEIMLWFHAEGEEPDWFPPEIEGIKNGELKYHGFTEHYVNAHIEEIPENGADVAHLYHLHTPFLAAGRDLRYQFTWVWQWIKHVWDGGWTQDEDNKHIGILTLDHSIAAFGRTVPLTTLRARAHQIGPGLCHLNIDHSAFGYSVLVQTVTPVEPLVQKLVHCIYTNRRYPDLSPRYLCGLNVYKLNVI
ncbi:cholesterol 7-desaturase nvd-like isoform X1 [Amphiura filiformis]|uniref:cholesterol 7-desaturase nvd-like isoform X1 n=1 Tax=Amphiura filiformis TaxID=82378 RepID=UPI003B20BC79